MNINEISGITKNKAAVFLFNHLSTCAYCSVNKNQKTGTVRIPIFSICSQNRLTSSEPGRAIMAKQKAQTAKPASIQIMELRPGARCLRANRIANTDATMALISRIMTKIFHCVSNKARPTFQIK